MRLVIALSLLAALGCKKEEPKPIGWPSELTKDWKRVTIEEGTDRYTAVLESGVWRLAAPKRGDADPDTIDRLKFALGHPQVLSARGVEGHALAAKKTITLETSSGQTWRLGVHPIVLGAPVAVTIQDLATFTVSPTEFANKLPQPEELLSAGLWVAAERHARTLSVTGPVSYELAGAGEDWEVRDGGKAARELDIPPGTITGRQAIGHPSGSLESLGLNPPVARARLCTEHECREFVFGSVAGDGGTHYYALAPDSDPVELRASDWKAVVDGPFE